MIEAVVGRMASFETLKFSVQAQNAFASSIHSLFPLRSFCFVSSFAAFLLGIFLLQVWIPVLCKRKRQKELSVPPGSFGLPLVGETLQWVRARKSNNSLQFLRTRVAKYGRVFKTNLMGHPTVVVTTPAGHRLLFANENKLVITSFPRGTKCMFGKESLLGKNGDEAKRIRSALLTFLRAESLRKFLARMDFIARRHLDEHWEGKEQLVIYPTMKSFTLSLAFTLFVSRYDVEEQRKFEEPFTTFIGGIFQPPINIPGTRFNKAMRAGKILREHFGEWMEERLKELKEGAVSADHDFLSYMLTFKDENNLRLTDECIKDNVLLLLFAGHDTSSVTLTILFKYLAENPDCCEDILKEQQEIASNKQPGEPLSWEDMQKMKISWRAVLETLRLRPPVDGGFLTAIKEFEFEGYKVPKDWQLHWSIWSTHHDPKLFREPKKFDPGRFEGGGPAPYTFVPFGLGPRMCPGNEYARMQILVLLHYVVRRFRWSVVDPNEQITLDPLPLPKNGLPIRLHKR